jgi:hypothetical protein
MYPIIYISVCVIFFFFLCITFSKFSPTTNSTLTVEGVDGYYQETKWVVPPSKTLVVISGESKTGTVLSVGLPLENSFISYTSGMN